MATRVDDLPKLSTIVGDEVVVVLQANNNLATVNTGQLRGAGWFWSDVGGVPSTDFAVAATGWAPSYGPFRDGDFFRMKEGSSFKLYYWSSGAWIELTDTLLQPSTMQITRDGGGPTFELKIDVNNQLYLEEV